MPTLTSAYNSKTSRHTIIIVLALILIIGTGYVLWRTYLSINEINTLTIVKAAENYADTVTKYRNYYSEVIVPRAKEAGMSIRHDYKTSSYSLPLPATFTKDFTHYLGKQQGQVGAKLYSDLPFPWRKNDTMDHFEAEALRYLRLDPTQAVWAYDTIDGQQVIRYAQADILTVGCVNCHNTYTGTPRKDWKAGDVRGVLEVIRPIFIDQNDTFSIIRKSFIIIMLLVLAMVAMIFIIINKLAKLIKDTSKAYFTSDEANKKLTTEIKQRKEISQKLSANEYKMRAIVNSIDEVILVIDKDGTITECNDIVKQMFLHPVNEVVGKNISILLPEESLQQLETLQNNDEEQGTAYKFQAKRKDHKLFPIELFITNNRADNDVLFTWTIRDITQRDKAEKMQHEAHQAAIRSAALKSEFLANMSHEIRTPMNAVIGMSEMLLSSKQDSKQRGYSKIIKDSAQSLLVIINDILDFSKIEAKKLTLEMVDFDLLHVIESSVSLLSTQAAKKQIDLSLFINNNVPLAIYNDPHRLRQVLLNLLNNALKFTDKGHVILKISKTDDNMVRFEIIDTGIGIKSKDLDLLFDKFSQVDGSSSRSHGGTGLGLAISKELILLMGGEVTASSVVNQGSNFGFTIPAPEALGMPYIDAKINALLLSESKYINHYYQHQMQQWSMNSDIARSFPILQNKLNTHQYELIAIDIDDLVVEFDHDLETIKEQVLALHRSTDAHIILYGKQPYYTQIIQLALPRTITVLGKPIKHSEIKSLFEKGDRSEGDLEPEIIETQTSVFDAEDKSLSEDKREQEKSETEDIITKNEANLQVLVVEDNLINQKVALALLSKLKLDVDIANNGKEALENLEDKIYDAIFMDCQMPVMDGYQASEAIRKLADNHPNKDVPIIAFTAHAMQSDKDKCFAAGMDDYLSKPIDINQLEEVYQRWLSKMRERSELRG